MSEKTVFISYRRDATGKLFARAIKEALTHHGYDVFLDVDCLDAGKWATQILTQVPKRAHFLLLLTPGALDRCIQEDDWVRREFLDAVAWGRNIVPVREESVDLGDLRKARPDCVKGLFDYEIATIQHAGFARDVETLIERFIPPHKAPAEPVTPRGSAAGFPADISRIIKYAPAELIGRDAEIKLLSGAWAKVRNAELPRPHVLTFVALGGEGKTSLVAKWAADLAHQDWPGCDAVFGWTFYSQGTRDQAVASSDLFLKEALTFFGDTAMANSAQGAFDKGRRLAQLVGERRALLILDGLEPLQYAPSSPTPGELKDQGLAALLKGLAATSHGLCVVTTRYSIPDLRAYWQTTALEVKLTRLSKEAGVALLKNLGVKGNQKELETLVEDVQGHALTLNLLGSYLRDAHAGDIRKRDLVKLAEADAEEQGGHAFRVMDAYALSFEREGEKGKRALALLRLLGLFDRPATPDCLDALWKGDAIADLTQLLVGLSEVQRNVAFTRLEAAKLLTVNRDAAGTLLSLDAHPLLREYFARQLRTQQPEAWRAAHRRLYEHLCATTTEGDQPTLEELQPLYQAVAHGCQAGLQQETCDKVFFARIKRRQEAYSSRKLGAFGSDLGAVACFFEPPWSRVSPVLTEADQAWLLHEAGYCLRALGRLTEALEPMRGGLEMGVQQENWNNAARRASNLSELELTLGAVAGAAEHAEQCVSYADSSDDAFMRTVSRAKAGVVLHQAGRWTEAETRFREAEQLQAERQPEYPLLYSLQGFNYCDLLLREAERAAWQLLLNPQSEVRNPKLLEACRAVEQRAKKMFEWRVPSDSLLDIALDYLTLGRAVLYAAILEKSAMRNPKSEIDQAVAGLRRAGQSDHLPRGLLTRAWCFFAEASFFAKATKDGSLFAEATKEGPGHKLQGRTSEATCFEQARADLDEAWDIAERGPMPLFMADIHLHRARLFGIGGRVISDQIISDQLSVISGEKYPWESPQYDLAEARRLVVQHGYLRRMPELEDAEHAIALGRR